MIIAIDGPAGSGKSTVAKLVADNLGFTYVDSGAMYRAVAAHALQYNIDINDEHAVARAARAIDLEQIDEAAIRTPEVSRAVAIVATYPEVRELAVAKQRQLAENSFIVMEGRDIGSVVFPDAEIKIYLNASVKERAQRRFQELHIKGEDVSLEQIEKDIIKRDKTDQKRKTSPLVKLPDAVEIDTTGLSIDGVVEKICECIP